MVQSENTEKHTEFLTNKDQAWQDLHRLTQDDDSKVRMHAASVLGSAFRSIPGSYKDQDMSLDPPDLSKIVEEELKKLAIGKILFNPPQEMKANVMERVGVRITKTITEDLTVGLRGRGVPSVATI